MTAKLAQLERKLGVAFENKDLLLLALSHRSHGHANNERLEFLGDAVLNLVVSEALFADFPQADEGQLSRIRARLVCGETLTALAREMQIGEHLRLGSGELKSGGFRRDSILADTLEAVIGALYLDAGIAKVREHLLIWLAQYRASVTLTSTYKDPKTRLQELLQARGAMLPRYVVTDTQGEPHCRTFFVECSIDLLQEPTQGEGPSRRIAEQVAATKALVALGMTEDSGAKQ